MKKIYLFLSFVMAFSALQNVNADKQPTDYVNQYIGTGGHGHTFMGANVPMGRIQVGPNGHTRGWDWCSGYHYSDSICVGFGSMHLSGTGIGSLGDICLAPLANEKQYELKFKHEDEKCAPGYYAVRLHEPEVNVELTCTKRVAMHRYQFTGTEETQLFALDLKHSIGWNSMTECDWKQTSPTQIVGWRRSTGWSNDRYTYFVADFSMPVEIVNSDSTFRPLLRINTKYPVTVKIALSPKSLDNAKANMQAEIPGWDFDAVAQKAREDWNKVLGRVTLKGGTEDEKTNFYTAMYHLLIAPSVYSDVNDKQTTYTTFSLWDTYRAAHPALTLLFPEIQADLAETFMGIYDQQGKLPIWHLMGCDTECMVGCPGVIVLADLVLKGFVQDKERAFNAMKASMLKEDRGLNTLKEYGYLPYDKTEENETVSKGLEYCIADAAVAKVAKMLGKTEDYKYFYNRSMSYKKYFDKKTGFMRAVSSKGVFRTPFDPIKSTHRVDDYTEGNAWQYTWLVPHDPEGLVKLFGGKKKFMKKLDELFVTEGDLGAEASPDISGLIGQYAHGNEPGHHTIYLYNYIGEYAKAEKMLNKVYKEMYRNEPNGLEGNEDVGQMSAWYILSTLGIYQVDPAGGRFVIGCPLFDEAEVQLPNGKVVRVIKGAKGSNGAKGAKGAKGSSGPRALWNGKPLKNSWIDYAELMQGGELTILSSLQ